VIGEKQKNDEEGQANYKRVDERMGDEEKLRDENLRRLPTLPLNQSSTQLLNLSLISYYHGVPSKIAFTV
jgi:hypothetical protein